MSDDHARQLDRALIGDGASGSTRDVDPSVDPPVATLREASLLLFERLVREPRTEAPRVARIGRPPVRTGFGLVDTALGGVVPGHVCLVVATSTDVRTAVLAKLVMTWPHQNATPALLAGPGQIWSLVAAILGASAGVSRKNVETGDLSAEDWSALTLTTGIGNQAGLPYLFSGNVRSARDLDASLLGYSERPPAIVAVDLADLTLRDLAGWTELARVRRVPVVIGLDARSPAARDHALPELMLSRLAASPIRTRFAAHGARADGSFSHRTIVDIDAETLSVATYDPTNQCRDHEPPDDPDLVAAPEATWATPEVT